MSRRSRFVVLTLTLVTAAGCGASSPAAPGASSPSDLAPSVSDVLPSAPARGDVSPSASVDAGPSVATPSAVPSGSPEEVAIPVVETPPSALPADTTGSMSTLIYSKFRLGCRDAYRLDLTTGASTTAAGCDDEVSPDGRSVASPDGHGLIRDPTGGATIRVDELTDASPLAWSPDGRWLAWVGAQDPSTGRPAQAGIVSADGSHQVRLPAPMLPGTCPPGRRTAATSRSQPSADCSSGRRTARGSSRSGRSRTAGLGSGRRRFAYLQGGDVWIADVNGTHPANLTRSSSAARPMLPGHRMVGRSP